MPLPIWQELLVTVEMTYLRLSPVYWGWGIPPGNGSAVIVIPAFLGADFYLAELRSWLHRIGYKPYQSSIGWNAECPNLLSLRLCSTIDKAYKSTRRKVHLVGHSLGGVIARAAAAQMPERISSVISLGSPFNGIAVHPSIRRAAEFVREKILHRHGQQVLPDCYTFGCTCDFLNSLVPGAVPKSVRQTAIYTKLDGIVDWHCCKTGDPRMDCEVSATHIGLAFNPIVYRLIAERLAAARASRRELHHASKTRTRRAA